MISTSGKSPHSHLINDVYEFFNAKYTIDGEVVVHNTDLSDDNAFGFTEIDGDEQLIQIHNDLTEREYVTTLLHELIHVVQNEQGISSDMVREDQAYYMEAVLFKSWCDSLQGVH